MHQQLLGELVPPDDGFGTPGNRTLSTPPLVEVADTGPFFHDNSVDTLEGAVAFYGGPLGKAVDVAMRQAGGLPRHEGP